MVELIGELLVLQAVRRVSEKTPNSFIGKDFKEN
jgi:hypothetical protein